MQALPPALPAAAPDSLATPYLPGLYHEGRGQDPGDMWGPLGNGLFWGKRVKLFGTLRCLQARKGLAAKANVCDGSPPVPSRLARDSSDPVLQP